jgi:radical SAM superfamily enzyme YgiQ (UPF0313 family)
VAATSPPILTYEAERPLSELPRRRPVDGLRARDGRRHPPARGRRHPAARRRPRRARPDRHRRRSAHLLQPQHPAPFVDVLLSGECEELLPETLDAILADPAPPRRDRGRRGPPARRSSASSTPGEWHELPEPAKAPLELLPARSAILTPDTELADMFLVEPERGCSRKCSFCVMRVSTNGGMRLLPMATPLGLVPEHARKVGLVGAAVTDHPELEDLVAALVDSGRSVSISSLRADRLTPRFLHDMQRSGHRTITVASDGISERMRVLLERKIKEEHLCAPPT